MQIYLVVRAPKKPEKRVQVHHDVIIGRSKECNFQVLSSEVSRRHCRLIVKEDGLSVRDLGSGNGTLINGEPIEANTDVDLLSGAKLKIGPVRITVEYDTSAATNEAGAPLVGAATEGEVYEDPEMGAVEVDASDETLEAFDTAPEAALDALEAVELEAGELEPDDDPEAVTEPPKKKRSLFGRLRKTKDDEPDELAAAEDEPAIEEAIEITAESEELAIEPLEPVDEALAETQPAVVVPDENALVAEDDDTWLGETMEVGELEEGEYEYDEETAEGDDVDAGFADFLNQIDDGQQ